MDKAALRPFVFDVLRKSPQTHFHAIENDVRRLAESYERQDVLLLQEILWELLVQGVLAPGKNSLNLNLPFVHVTEYGSRCLEDGAALAHDPDRYMERMQEVVGDRLDEFVAKATREALDVFLAGSWSASVVLLAQVAKYLFLRLVKAWSVVDAESSIQESPFPEAVRLRSIQQFLAWLKTSSVFPDAPSIEPQLNGLLAIIQLSTNPDGTPRWPEVSRDQVMGHFLLFPKQCACAIRTTRTLEERTG